MEIDFEDNVKYLINTAWKMQAFTVEIPTEYWVDFNE